MCVLFFYVKWINMLYTKLIFPIHSLCPGFGGAHGEEGFGEGSPPAVGAAQDQGLPGSESDQLYVQLEEWAGIQCADPLASTGLDRLQSPAPGSAH